MPRLRFSWRLLIGLIGSALIVWGLGFLALWAYVQRPGIVTLTNFQRIQPGMRESEVQTLLGSPGLRSGIPGIVTGEYVRDWHGEKRSISVLFDRKGLVRDTVEMPTGNNNTGWETLRARLSRAP